MAMTGNATVLGVFRDRALAESAANELRQAGFHDDQITFLSHHAGGGAFSGLRNLFSGQNADANTQTPDMLANLNLSAPEKDYYQRELDAGNTLLAVQAGDHEQDANAILNRHGAYNAGTMPLDQSTRIIPLRAEELSVNKQTVMSGEIRVHKRIITEDRTFTVPVTREELIIEHIGYTDGPDHIQTNRANTIIERNPAGQAGFTERPTGMSDAATPPYGTDATRMSSAQMAQNNDEVLREGGTLRIVLHEDQVTINKQTIVTEEIVIRKELVQEMRQVTDTARHEEMRVTSAGNPIIHNTGIDITNEAIDDRPQPSPTNRYNDASQTAAMNRYDDVSQTAATNPYNDRPQTPPMNP